MILLSLLNLYGIKSLCTNIFKNEIMTELRTPIEEEDAQQLAEHLFLLINQLQMCNQ